MQLFRLYHLLADGCIVRGDYLDSEPKEDKAVAGELMIKAEPTIAAIEVWQTKRHIHTISRKDVELGPR